MTRGDVKRREIKWRVVTGWKRRRGFNLKVRVSVLTRAADQSQRCTLWKKFVGSRRAAPKSGRERRSLPRAFAFRHALRCHFEAVPSVGGIGQWFPARHVVLEKDATYEFAAAARACLVEDRFQVILHGVLGDPKDIGDRLGRESL